MRKVFTIVLFGILLLVGFGVIGYVAQQNSVHAPVARVTSMVSPTVFTSSVSPMPSESDDVSKLREGGSSYKDPQGIFVVFYPSDYTFNPFGNNQVRVYKIGSTQAGQTEMYDGVNIVFQTISLQNQTLNTWVDNYIKNLTADKTVEIIQPKKSITLNSYSGFSFTTRSLGVSEYFILQKDTASPHAVMIIWSVNDPENKGYQKEANAILSTLEILK